MIKSDCYMSGKFCFRISNLIQKSTMQIRYKLYVLTRPILNLKKIYFRMSHYFNSMDIEKGIHKNIEKGIHKNIETIP